MAIDHALAKKLRDAGFPVEVQAIVTTAGVKTEETFDLSSIVLSELIKACDTEFYRLHRLDGEHWMADDVNGRFEEVGDTPQEAIARLFLALKK